jgi:hypothetical protein
VRPNDSIAVANSMKFIFHTDEDVLEMTDERNGVVLDAFETGVLYQFLRQVHGD